MSNYDLGLFNNRNRLLSALGPKGQAVQGPLKASQKFASTFLTEQGSIPYRPDYGTEFLYYLRYSMIRTDADVVMYFNQSVTDVLDYINSDITEDSDIPDDEIIETVVLDHFELEPPRILLYVVLTMVSGDTVNVILPAAVIEVEDAD